ncbi:hypothetical protein NUW54_g14546 [Trametes sanguinea]|uniref:Uncharacterized protein n=1 Tax=Trametes sanguinea TaxID=158606 RepID=A0ACC1MCX8_9APHY|nr:hypothetical protein NUW54_g14546 [Trametes sanguinea]
MLSAPVDQQKHTLAELHERVRLLSAERDEIAGRLHAALNEITLLRQELSRFVPNARMVPAHERLLPPQSVPQRVVSMPPPQRMVAEQRAHSLTFILPRVALTAALRQPPTSLLTSNSLLINSSIHNSSLSSSSSRLQGTAQSSRCRHTDSPQGNVSPSSSAAPPPTIAHLRRTSAPAPIATSQNGVAPSPVSASLNSFSGLSIASPVAPMSGQMPTVGSPASTPAGDFAPPPPPLSTSPLRTIHPIPVTSKPSLSSLAARFGEEAEKDGSYA